MWSEGWKPWKFIFESRIEDARGVASQFEDLGGMQSDFIQEMWRERDAQGI